MSDPDLRWKCKECGWTGNGAELLSAPNPFDPTYTISGCPQCQTVDSFDNICDEPGCNDYAGCGWKPKDAPYRRTCSKHMGKHDYNAALAAKEQT